MGASLARREARVLVEELAARAGGIQLESDPTPRASSLVHTFDHLPVHLDEQRRDHAMGKLCQSCVRHAHPNGLNSSAT